MLLFIFKLHNCVVFGDDDRPMCGQTNNENENVNCLIHRIDLQNKNEST